jgi:signal peptidase I
MHPSFFLVTLLALLSLAILAFCLWLSLRVFGLKPVPAGSYKIIGCEAVFLTATGLIDSAVGGTLTAPLSLLSLIGGAVLWIMLLKRFAPQSYTLGRAIGAYITGYVFASVIALVAAIVGIAFFAQIYKIDGNSMAPALKANQTVLVYKFDKQPDNNMLIVYRTDKGTQALGRVRGLPGQSVVINGGRVEVAGKLQEVSSFTLGDNQYYVTTDNASYSIPPRIVTADSIAGTIGPKF